MAGRSGEQPGLAAWSPTASLTRTGPVHVLPPTLPSGLVSSTPSTNLCPFPARCSQNPNSLPSERDQKFNVVQPPLGLNSWASHTCARPCVHPYIHPGMDCISPPFPPRSPRCCLTLSPGARSHDLRRVLGRARSSELRSAFPAPPSLPPGRGDGRWRRREGAALRPRGRAGPGR